MRAFVLNQRFWQALTTRRLNKELGPEGVISLLKLLAWAAENRPNGYLEGMDETDIELVAEWNGEPGKFGEAAEITGCLRSWQKEGVTQYSCPPCDYYLGN